MYAASSLSCVLWQGKYTGGIGECVTHTTFCTYGALRKNNNCALGVGDTTEFFSHAAQPKKTGCSDCSRAPHASHISHNFPNPFFVRLTQTR